MAGELKAYSVETTERNLVLITRDLPRCTEAFKANGAAPSVLCRSVLLY